MRLRMREDILVRSVSQQPCEAAVVESGRLQSGLGLELGTPGDTLCPSGPPCCQPLRWTLATLFPVPFPNRWGRKFQKRWFIFIDIKAV